MLNRRIGLLAMVAVVPLLVWGAGILLLPGTTAGRLWPMTLALSLVIWGLSYLLARQQAVGHRLTGSPGLFVDLVEAAPDSILVHRDNRILYANRRALEFFNISSYEPFTETSLMEFIHPRYHDLVIARQQEVLRTREPSPAAEMTVVMLDGTLKDIFASTTTINLKGQQALLTFFRDITEQAATRRELLDSRERLQLAIEAAQDGVWDWDVPSGRMVYSRAWAGMLGFELEELQADQNAWLYLIHPDDHPRSNALLDAHLNGDLPTYETEVRLRHKEGHYIWVLDRGRVVDRDEEGRPLRMTGTHRNITARKEAELALEIRNRIAEIFLISEEKTVYRKLLETVIQGCDCQAGFFATVKDNGSLKILATQPERELYPQPGSTPSIHPSDVPSFMTEVITGQRGLILDRPHYVSPINQEFQTALVVPVISRHTVIGLFMLGNKSQGFFESERAQVESLATYMAPILQSHLTSEMRELQLRQAQKMEALGALAGGISHDFNNILQAIMGFTTLAREEAPEESLIATDLERALKAARRGQDLVQRILLFSRREEQEQHPVDAHAIMVEALELLMPSMPSTIEVRPLFDDKCGRIMADPSQINQVVMNLATNAYHAMEEDGGVLEIGLKLVDSADIKLEDSDLAGHRQLVKIWVSDTGPGISPQQKERVFEPFFTTKEVGRGTGLGLSVVHGIVISHRGEVQIDSRVGKGTEVAVYLPLHQSPRRSAAADLAAAGSLTAVRPGSHILFIDDEEDIASIGKAMLEKQGYRVTALNDSAIALDTVRLSPQDFDMVVTDLTMPQVTGLHLAREIGILRQDLPVILITGLGDDKILHLESYPNISEVVHKPFSSVDLGTAVNRVMPEGPLGGF